MIVVGLLYFSIFFGGGGGVSGGGGIVVVLVVVVVGYLWRWGCSGSCGGGGDSPCKGDSFNNCRSEIVMCMLFG